MCENLSKRPQLSLVLRIATLEVALQSSNLGRINDNINYITKRKEVIILMDVIRCDIKNLEFALNSVNIVKKEFDNLKENISEDAMIKFLNDDKNYLIAAIDDGRVIGFVLSYELQRIDCDSKMMLLYEITVLKDYRKKGIGTILINYLKQICENENFMKMWVPTEHSNLSAVALYKKTGAKMSKMNDEVLFTWYSPFIDN